MNKNCLFMCTVAVIITATAYSQVPSQNISFHRGKVIEGLTMKSEILGKEIPYAVYLPYDYDKSDRNYPVVYLLHGYSDDETAWIQFGEVNETADRAIATREIPPIIIVMPDAEVTWYINDYKNIVPYEDMIFKEFIPYIDQNYKTRAKKEFRAVAGLSMGGYGSLIWALHHPDVFSSCAAFSAAIHTDESMMNMAAERYEQWYSRLYGQNDDGKRITDHWHQNSVLYLIETMDVRKIEQVRFYIDCGDDDFLYEGNSMLHIYMRDRYIDHEYRVRDGKHNWTYWRENIGEGLRFISESFKR